MSWDVVVFSSTEKINSIEDLDPEKLLPVDFDSVIQRYFPDLVKDGEHRQVEKEDWALEFFFDNEPSPNMIFSLYGEHALFHLVLIAREQNWQIFDTALGEMIDLDHPECNGYENFQRYVEQIRGRGEA